MRILCGADFSTIGDYALARAARLARQLDAELHVVHAFSVPVAALPEGAVMGGPMHVDEASTRAHEAMRAREQQYPDLDLVRHVVLGPATDEILRVADEIDADYIVMGTHGRTGWRHLVMGSVAEQVVRRAKVPVLTVPDPAKRQVA